MKHKHPYRVLVCDNLALARLQVQQALENTSEFHLVGQAAGAHDSIARAIELKPDLVLLDVCTPDLDGAEATRQILLGAPEIKILAYSADCCWDKVDRMLAAGACGYVVKSPDSDELVRAARTVLAGGHYLSLALMQPAAFSD
jgi:DNA-binding NarL/FixJ family response regulator